MTFRLYVRLIRLAGVCVRQGVFLRLCQAGISAVPAEQRFRLATLRGCIWMLRCFEKRRDSDLPQMDLAEMLTDLGPAYVKLGQFLATRPDIVGFVYARDLASLQDDMPCFPRALAVQRVEAEFHAPLSAVFSHFGEPVAAASIAQVQKAWIVSGSGKEQEVAVKILRPGIAARFAKDLQFFAGVAGFLDRNIAALGRLRLPAVIQTLARSVELEMDLRMEAAALSEMAENFAEEEGFRVPRVYWQQSSRQVLTMEWMEGIPLGDREALLAAGHDLPHLARLLVQSFLRQAIRDGFFHGDLHQGNLLVDSHGCLVAVDFGITGRLSLQERYFLAEILWGFLRRDYQRIADVHFEAGYVPPHQSREMFAQALRAIGESVFSQDAKDISMARLLAQLFEVTQQFAMETRPELLLLQKSMLVVEGVCRTLDPEFNMWTSSEPVVEEWMRKNMGSDGAMQGMTERLVLLNRFGVRMPEFFSCLETIVQREAQKELGSSRKKRWGFRKFLILFFCAVLLLFFAERNFPELF